MTKIEIQRVVNTIKLKNPQYYVEDHYIVENGRFVFYSHKKSNKGIWESVKTKITENFYIILDEDIIFDPELNQPNRWKGKIVVRNDKEIPFDTKTSDFFSGIKITKFLLRFGGSSVIFGNLNANKLRLAIQKTSTPTQVFVRKLEEKDKDEHE